MPRLSGWLATFALWLVVALPSLVLAQSEPMPDRGEVLELRRDDPRAREGYRAFIFGSFVRGMPSIAHVLERVNADLDESERVSFEQFDHANPCQVIYHYAGVGNRHNGHCTSNPTRERVSYESFCGGAAAHQCVRWPMAGRVYYVPARSVLTPGERAEEMARRLDETSVTETVPAPAQLGSWLTELSGLMGEDQAPSYDQVRGVIEAVGRTLTRAESADAANDPSVGSPDSEPAAAALSGVPSGEADARTTPDDVESPHPTNAVSSRSTSSSTSSEAATFWTMNPRYLWLIIVILSVTVILLLLKDIFRSWSRPTLEFNESPPADHGTTALTEEQERDLKLLSSIRKSWNDLWKKDEASREFTEDEILKFFMTADTNRWAITVKEKRIQEQEERIKNLEADIVQEQGAHHELAQQFGAFKLRAAELMNRFHKDGITELQGGIERVIRVGDDSQPRLLSALDGMQQLKDQFNAILDGVYRELVMNLAPDVALFYAKQAVAVPTNVPDSSMREQLLDQAADRISRESLIHGAAPSELAMSEPVVASTVSSDSASVDQSLELPAVQSAASVPASPSSIPPIPPEDQDNVLINPKHLVARKTKRQRREEKRKARRERANTQTYGLPQVTAEDLNRSSEEEESASSEGDSLLSERPALSNRTGDTLRPTYYPSSDHLSPPASPIASLPEDGDPEKAH